MCRIGLYLGTKFSIVKFWDKFFYQDKLRLNIGLYLDIKSMGQQTFRKIKKKRERDKERPSEREYNLILTWWYCFNTWCIISTSSDTSVLTKYLLSRDKNNLAPLFPAASVEMMSFVSESWKTIISLFQWNNCAAEF